MRNEESKTVYMGGKTLRKDDGRIILRGELDSLLARAVMTCAYAKQYGYTEIVSGCEDIVRVLREIVKSEALGTVCEVREILGMDFDELRQVSHNPRTELGAGHYFPDENTDSMTAMLNLLRTDARREERYCAAVLEEHPSAEGLIAVLNRLSSAAYILMIECSARFE